jgi:hypothetical protein
MTDEGGKVVPFRRKERTHCSCGWELPHRMNLGVKIPPEIRIGVPWGMNLKITMTATFACPDCGNEFKTGGEMTPPKGE